MPGVGEEPGMREWAAELVDRARTEGVELTGDNGLLTALVRQVLQTGLEVEMLPAEGMPRFWLLTTGPVRPCDAQTSDWVDTAVPVVICVV